MSQNKNADIFRAQELHKSADVLASKGDRKSALGLLIKASVLYPDDPVHWHCRGVNEFNTGLYGDAARSYRRAVGLEETPERLRFLAEAQTQSGDYRSSVVTFRKAVGQIKDDPDVWFGLARALRLSGDTPESNTVFEKVVALTEESVDQLGTRGRAFTHLKRYGDAVKSYSDALKHDPDDTYVRLELAESLLFNGENTRALSEIDDAIRRGADLSHAQFHRGQALANLRKDEQALEAFAQVVSVGGNASAVPAARAKVLISADRFEEALIELEVATRTEPVDELVWFNLGVVKFRLSEYAPALTAYERALLISPENHNFLKAAAHAQMKLGDFLGAKQRLQKVVALSPSDHSGWCGLGEVHFRLNQFEASGRAYRKSINIEVGHSEAKLGLAASLISSNNENRALVELRDVKSDDSMIQLIEFNRGVAYYRLGVVPTNVVYSLEAGVAPSIPPCGRW